MMHGQKKHEKKNSQIVYQFCMPLTMVSYIPKVNSMFLYFIHRHLKLKQKISEAGSISFIRCYNEPIRWIP